MTQDPSIPPAPGSESAVAPPAEPATVLAPPSNGPSTPYRMLLVPSIPVPAVRRPSLLGAALYVFGVLLWAFVVMGELTTSYGPGKHHMIVGEALAVVFVLGTTGAAWAVALRTNLDGSLPASPLWSYLRGGFIALVALALWFLAVSCAVAFGNTGRNLDGPITLLLLIVAVAAALGGLRLSAPKKAAAPGRPRALRRFLWAGAGLLTLVAFVLVLES